MANKISSAERRESNQALILILVICAFLFLIIAVPFFVKNQLNNFSYEGIPFVKEKQGEIIFYHGRVPVFVDKENTRFYNMYLRNDPRKNNVSVLVNFSFSNQVSLSLENEAGFCSDSVLAHGLLGEFVTSYLHFVKKINYGVTDDKTAKELNLAKITCNNASTVNTVIITRISNETSIVRGERPDCYYLNVGKCENLRVVEKFVTEVIAQSGSVTLS